MYDFPFRERRHYIRSVCAVDILCAIPSKVEWLDVFTVRSKNISRRGFFLQTNDIIQPGRELYMQFCLVNYTTHFRIYTKVIWNRFDPIINGMGVYFEDIGEKFEEMIEHYVLKHYDFKSASNF